MAVNVEGEEVGVVFVRFFDRYPFLPTRGEEPILGRVCNRRGPSGGRAFATAPSRPNHLHPQW